MDYPYQVVLRHGQGETAAVISLWLDRLIDEGWHVWKTRQDDTGWVTYGFAKAVTCDWFICRLETMALAQIRAEREALAPCPVALPSTGRFMN